jgi:sterol desaturase/sphingolipid hydroxylase (fatty acid hydroxylase superfamily)
MKNFVSNSQESVRMFKSSLLEALSKVPFYVPLIVYVPVIGYCIYRAYETNVGLGTFFEYMLLGLFVWTFTEYILHRFVFHYLPKPKWGKRLHFIFHGVHHDYPSDALRLVMPPSASIPLALLFYYLFKAMLPVNYIYAFFPGFIVGYLFYDISHYAIHHFNFKGAFWKKIKQHHMLHHYQDPTKGYGVSSPLWDKIFRSDFIKK